ncbi:hypothetical protein [Pedobacter mendelii]|uniref:Uncharacterized protein n=1 Tax=Pedobacter mendelii TaxID=1908240 RepID=A0ABQ2BKS9_9SPHI|nr:hypothetical protein [Pedobacter mendelii]GGI25842.1 hypothetical protein GCM10008119_19690 [Pedobacter mendelii]
MKTFLTNKSRPKARLLELKFKTKNIFKNEFFLMLFFVFGTFGNSSYGQDKVSKILDKSYIWNTQDSSENVDLHVAFRKSFNVINPSSGALLSLFAYNRFAVYINGKYVMRGPVRFENSGPQYASINISSYLKKGKNVIAVVSHRFEHTGQIMAHQAGFSALIDLKVMCIYQ